MSASGSGVLEVLQPGIGSTVQDRGRPGHRHNGVPLSGWLDALLATAANALVGNQGEEAVLECRGVGTELRVQSGPVRLALAGSIKATWIQSDSKKINLPAWQSATLQAGDRLTLGTAETGCAYLAVAGGLQLPQALGSRSSYWRAGFPGVLGRALRPGDQLPCNTWESVDAREWRFPTPWSLRDDPIRVILGPQADHFPPEAMAQFLHEQWQATTEQDRMGIRLQGTPLAHTSAAAADIVSDATTPGTIQVPASGQPIILLADSQTVGGYPKIATVISADLPRLAHLKAGSQVRFEAVDATQARRALQEQHTVLSRWLQTREAFVPAGFIDEHALLQCNLISGVLRADPLTGDIP